MALQITRQHTRKTRTSYHKLRSKGLNCQESYCLDSYAAKEVTTIGGFCEATVGELLDRLAPAGDKPSGAATAPPRSLKANSNFVPL